MKKIMFNDRYGLTQAVIEGRKTMTRRLIPDEFFGLTWDTRGDTLVYENEYGDFIDVRHSKYTRYKVGEVVAVAQSYSTIAAGHPDVYTFLPQVAKAHKISIESVHDLAGWNNKMFTKAELMPHQIRIIGIKHERLRDISDEDCINEGIFVNEYVGKGKKCHHYGFDGFFNEAAGWFARGWYNTQREAFAILIDKVSGRGTWERNPWVVVCEFELVK
jgi:hypothetical protein